MDDVRFGRSFVVRRNPSAFIPGLRLFPIGAAVSPRKIRIMHDLTFIACPGASSVNANTNFESAPKMRLGRVLRDIYGGLCYCGLATLAQQTSPRDAVVTKQGRNATQHVEVRSPVAPECPASPGGSDTLRQRRGRRGSFLRYLLYGRRGFGSQPG